MDENKIKFGEVIETLKDVDHPFPARLLRGFSDLSPGEVNELVQIWKEVPVLRKKAILEDLEEISDHDTLVCFDEFAKAILEDADPGVRVLTLRLLWECEDSRVIPQVIEMLKSDDDEGVRATAASLLGRFVYLGELDEIPESIKIPLVMNLLEVATGDDRPQVRMRVLESLGYSGHAKVPELIQNAFRSEDHLWVASALCAMGRSADDQWSELVLEKLDSGDPEIQFEAVRAAGELELTNALDQLFTILEEQENDSEIRLAAIWSLSQIGGSEVKQKLRELLKDSESDEEIEWIEKALDNLELSGSADALNFFNFKPDGDEEELDEDDEYSEEENEGEAYDEEDFDSLDEFDEDDEEE